MIKKGVREGGAYLSIVLPFAVIVAALVVALPITLPSPSSPFIVVVGDDDGDCWVMGHGVWCW